MQNIFQKMYKITNRNFTELIRRYNINQYSTFSFKKAAIVELAIRTFKTWLHKEFSTGG